MTWPKKLVLVRHAESIGNVLSRDERTACPTSTHEYPLTEKGRKQASLTGKWLENEFGGFDIHYVSYYRRSKETMSIMFPDARVYEDPRLAEAQRGIYHAVTDAEMQKKWPEEIARKEREGYYHYRPWGGENWPDVELRIHSFLGTLARDCDGQDVIMVVHGHWLLLFQRLIHHFSIDEAIEKYKDLAFKNASVTTYEEINGHLALKMENFAPWEFSITA
jgi:broad specificity phosphatase PhoE